MSVALGYSTRESRENQFEQGQGPACRLLVLSLMVFLFLPGCSWIFVRPAKVDNNYPNPVCSTSRVAPVIDTLLAINDFAGIALFAAMDDVENRKAKMLGAVLGTILFTSSAYYGYSNTSQCIENQPEGWDKSDDPEDRARLKKKKKPTGPLQPEPGVMRSS